jgi:hypothetical protein
VLASRWVEAEGSRLKSICTIKRSKWVVCATDRRPEPIKKGRKMNGNGQGLSEDLLSLIIGLVIFVLALGLLGGVDILGG